MQIIVDILAELRSSLKDFGAKFNKNIGVPSLNFDDLTPTRESKQIEIEEISPEMFYTEQKKTPKAD